MLNKALLFCITFAKLFFYFTCNHCFGWKWSRPALWTVDHASSITCHYLLSFYTVIDYTAWWQRHIGVNTAVPERKSNHGKCRAWLRYVDQNPSYTDGRDLKRNTSTWSELLLQIMSETDRLNEEVCKWNPGVFVLLFHVIGDELDTDDGLHHVGR